MRLKMNKRITAGYKWLVVTLLIGGLTVIVSAEQQIILPEPIPAGFDFPAARSVLQKIADERNVVAARKHAWQVWNGMSQDSKATTSEGPLPIWETWFSTEEITPPGATKPISLASILAGREDPSRPLQSPAQFHGGSAISHAGQLLSFNKFNPTAGAFINAPHLGPKGIVYYYLKDSLNQLNESWPEGTPIAERHISEFPLRSMETKPVFMVVKKDGLTPIPYWQGPLGSVDPTEPTPNTWTTCVLFDPKTKDTIRPATSEQKPNSTDGLNCETYLYAGLSQIYSYQLTEAGVEAIKNEQGGTAEVGDYAILVAMHVNTKEIVNWTWQTFFWTGGESPPNNYPGHMANQPDTIKTPWNNYAMCTAYWQENSDGSIKTCFNPYLETSTSGIPDGLNSNCMSCHGTARTPPLNNAISPNPSYPRHYIRAINVGPKTFDPFYFKGNTRTDFSWAVGNVAQ